MGTFLNKRRAECREFQSQLEDAAGAAPGARDISELLAAAPAGLAAHVTSCDGCRVSAENILAARALLAALPSHAVVAGPWFAPRVMAAIAARKAELGRAADTWTFLPRLASRLTWASSVALLLASAWLYQKPVSRVPTKTVATDITGEPLQDNVGAPSTDDVLASLAEKAQ